MVMHSRCNSAAHRFFTYAAHHLKPPVSICASIVGLVIGNDWFFSKPLWSCLQSQKFIWGWFVVCGFCYWPVAVCVCEEGVSDPDRLKVSTKTTCCNSSHRSMLSNVGLGVLSECWLKKLQTSFAWLNRIKITLGWGEFCWMIWCVIVEITEMADNV